MRIRDKLLSQPSAPIAEIYEDPEVGFMVFRQVGFLSALKINDLSGADRVVFLLMNCVCEAVPGEDGEPLVGEDGVPLVGKPVFDKVDEEALRTTDHPLGGWFMRIVSAVSEFMERTSVDVGKTSATG